jgi:hypothetical protein
MKKGKVLFKVLRDPNNKRCSLECYLAKINERVLLRNDICVNFSKALHSCYNICDIKIIRYEEREDTV